MDLVRGRKNRTGEGEQLGEFVRNLSEEVIRGQSLVEQTVVDDDAHHALRRMNDQLSLLEQLHVATATSVHAETLREIVASSGSEKVRLIRNIRESPEHEVGVLLKMVLRDDADPGVRKAAASALLYNGNPEGVAAVRSSFYEDPDPTVRSSSVYGLKPDVVASDRDYLIEQFAGFDVTVRRAAIELLLAATDSPAVEAFFANTDKFTAEERALLP